MRGRIQRLRGGCELAITRNLKNRLRGWFPKEGLSKNQNTINSTITETKIELDRKMRKTGMIANAVIYMGFGGLYFLVLQPFYNFHPSLELTALTVGCFTASLVSVNLAIYRYYKKQNPRGVQ
jgi:hypothetical protein